MSSPKNVLPQAETVSEAEDSSAVGVPTPIDEINYRCEAKEKKMHFKYYLDDVERRALLGTEGIGAAGCLLFEYYLRLAAKGELLVCDTEAARHFGWQKQKIQRHRLKLQKAGWFRQARSRYTDGRKAITYYVGREAVTQSHQTHEAVIIVRKKSPAKAPAPTPIPIPIATQASTPLPTESLFK